MKQLNPLKIEKQPYNTDSLKIYRNKCLVRSEGDGEECVAKPTGTPDIAVAVAAIEYHNESVSESQKVNKPMKELPNMSHFITKLKKDPSMSGFLLAAPDPVVLSAPPEDFEKKEKVLMLPTEAFTDIKKSFSSSSKRREPKFVPYEPYKGCVRPMFDDRCIIDHTYGITVEDQPQSQPFPDSNKASIESKREYDKLKIIISDFEREQEKWESENSKLFKENKSLKKDLNQTKKELDTSQQQLSTLSQINSELKKLLVASVGEDVQGRVQCLTEDKARMATMIRKYSEKVDKDYEEKEKIVIQCDVWRSKFLASSVLIDELACWKSLLLQRFESAKEALKLLLDERNVAHPNLINTYKYIYQVQEAFDPLHAESPGTFLLNSCDLVSTGVVTANMAESVRDRLLGNLGRPVGVTDLKLPQETRTPGEKLALQTIEEDLDPNGTLAMCAKDRSLAHRFHPHANCDRITMNCCAKCNGDIVVI